MAVQKQNRKETEPTETIGRRRPAAEAVSGAGAEYVGLSGASGKEIHYRPRRYAVGELGGLSAEVRIARSADGALQRFVLRDASQGGVAFFVDGDNGPRLGDELQELCVLFDDYEAYRGAARVSSAREEEGRQLCGVTLLDGLLNMDAVRALRDQVEAQRCAVDRAGEALMAWSGSEEYAFKGLMSEFALFLDDVWGELQRLEGELPWHVLNGDADSPSRQALTALLRDELVNPYVGYLSRLDAMMRAVDPDEHAPLKVFARRTLHPALLNAALFRRSFEKPLGYAGDYVIMTYIYGRDFVGDSLFARYSHLAAWHIPVCAAVRARATYISSQISAALDGWQPRDRAPRVLSVASGPAREIRDLFAQARADWPEFEVVLFDQDREALDHCYRELRQVALETGQSPERLRFQHDSIRHLLKDDAVFSGRGPFDLVFACGLFDYLSQRAAQALTRKLYQQLAPGGVLYVGNLGPDNPSRFTMEYLAEWYLIYRDSEQLYGVGDMLPPEAVRRVEVGPSGIERFLVVERPRGNG